MHTTLIEIPACKTQKQNFVWKFAETLKFEHFPVKFRRIFFLVGMPNWIEKRKQTKKGGDTLRRKRNAPTPSHLPKRNGMISRLQENSVH